MTTPTLKPVYGTLEWIGNLVLPMSPDPPENPAPGTFWANQNDGRNYIWTGTSWKVNKISAVAGTGIEFVEDPTTRITTINATGGGGGASAYYRHVQSTPSASWTISHMLSMYPSVTVVDSSKRVVLGDVQYLDPNTVSATFAGAFSGEAFCS